MAEGDKKYHNKKILPGIDQNANDPLYLNKTTSLWHVLLPCQGGKEVSSFCFVAEVKIVQIG